MKTGAWGSVVVKALRYQSDGFGIDSRWCHTGDFIRSYRRNHVPWGRLSLQKWIPGNSPGGEGGRCVRLTTYHPCSAECQENPTYPEPPWALKACCGRDLLYEDKYTFLIISCSVIFRMRNVADLIFRENQNTHFKFNFFFSKFMLFMR
jgi:hypothetical protein